LRTKGDKYIDRNLYVAGFGELGFDTKLGDATSATPHYIAVEEFEEIAYLTGYTWNEELEEIEHMPVAIASGFFLADIANMGPEEVKCICAAFGQDEEDANVFHQFTQPIISTADEDTEFYYYTFNLNSGLIMGEAPDADDIEYPFFISMYEIDEENSEIRMMFGHTGLNIRMKQETVDLTAVGLGEVTFPHIKATTSQSGLDAALWSMRFGISSFDLDNDANHSLIFLQFTEGAMTGGIELYPDFDNNTLELTESDFWCGQNISAYERISSSEAVDAWLAPTMKDITTAVGLENTARSIDTDGKYLYLGTYYEEEVCPLQIYSLADPANPVKVSPTTITNLPAHAIKGIRYQGGYLYIAFEATGGDVFRIVDVHDPTNPVVKGGSALTGFENSGGGATLDYENGVVYVTGQQTLYSVDVSDVDNPAILDSIVPISDGAFVCWTCKVQDGYVYVGGRNSTLGTDMFRIIDATDPSDMSVVGGSALNIPDGIWTLNVWGDYVYIASGLSFMESDNPKFYIVDVSNKTAPTIVSSLLSDLVSPSSYVKYVNGYCYLVNWSSSEPNLYVIDVRDPANPYIVAKKFYAPMPLTLAVHGKYLYLGFADFSRELPYLGVIEQPGVNGPTGFFHDLHVGFWGEELTYGYKQVRNGQYSHSRIPVMSGMTRLFDDGDDEGSVEEGVYLQKSANVIAKDGETNASLTFYDSDKENPKVFGYDYGNEYYELDDFFRFSFPNTAIESKELTVDLSALVPDLEITFPILQSEALSSLPEVVPFPYALGVYDSLGIFAQGDFDEPEIIFAKSDFSSSGSIGMNLTDEYAWVNWDWCGQEDGAYDNGTEDLRWKDGHYSGTVYAAGLTLGSTSLNETQLQALLALI
jgi:hypothetical protein